jgi:hypothetical protein
MPPWQTYVAGVVGQANRLVCAGLSQTVRGVGMPENRRRRWDRVEAIGGTSRVTSRRGEGTHLLIELPVRPLRPASG